MLVLSTNEYFLALSFERNIVIDCKKAFVLAQMLSRVSETKLEGVPNDPIIREGKTSISFSAPFVILKLTFTRFSLTNIRSCYQNKTSLAWPR